MSQKHPSFLKRLLRMNQPRVRASGTTATNVGGQALPRYGTATDPR